MSLDKNIKIHYHILLFLHQENRQKPTNAACWNLFALGNLENMHSFLEEEKTGEKRFVFLPNAVQVHVRGM